MTLLIESSRPLSKAQQACVDLLEEILIEAKEGKIESIAIGARHANGLAAVMAGPHAGDLNLCCDEIKQKIRAAIFEDGNVAAPRKSQSSIIKVR